MKVNTTEAPTNEIAIGMKIIDLAADSVFLPSWSTRVANPRPIASAAAGTTTTHRIELRMPIWYWLSVKTVWKLSKPTNSELSRFCRLRNSVLMAG